MSGRKRNRLGEFFWSGVGTIAAVDARRALLAELIDHAPLFPPASLPVDEALAEHERARASDDAWLLRRFVAPASLLAKLPGAGLRLSVVLDAPAELDDRRIEAVEVPPGVHSRPDAAEVYVEGSIEPGFRAKVRCGGARVPTVEELAGFVRRCREQRVVFKATAGLHHALPSDGQHGFLSLLAACVFGDEEAALRDDAFELDAEAFRWRDRVADPEQLARVRRELFAGFGSCSFTDPVDELRALRIL
jgi:hypothetical protein